MKRYLLTLVAALCAALVASSPAAALVVQGSLDPAASGDGYALLVSESTIDAQNGPDIVFKGTIGHLPWPPDPTYEVRVSLVPKAAYKQFLAGTITSLWNEGFWVAAYMDQPGSYAVAAEDYPLQQAAPGRSPVVDDGSITFKLILKPKVLRCGGWAKLKVVDGLAPNFGTSPLKYGRRLAGDPLASEDYSAARLVVQVSTEGDLSPVTVWAKAKKRAYGLRIAKVKTLDPTLTKQTVFAPGDAVVVRTKFLVFSTDPSLQYRIKGTVRILGTTQHIDEKHGPGTYVTSRTFMVPFGTSPGTYNAKVSLQLIFGGQVIYTDEALKAITVQ